MRSPGWGHLFRSACVNYLQTGISPGKGWKRKGPNLQNALLGCKMLKALLAFIFFQEDTHYFHIFCGFCCEDTKEVFTTETREGFHHRDAESQRRNFFSLSYFSKLGQRNQGGTNVRPCGVWEARQRAHSQDILYISSCRFPPGRDEARGMSWW